MNSKHKAQIEEVSKRIRDVESSLYAIESDAKSLKTQLAELLGGAADARRSYESAKDELESFRTNIEYEKGRWFEKFIEFQNKGNELVEHLERKSADAVAAIDNLRTCLQTVLLLS